MQKNTYNEKKTILGRFFMKFKEFWLRYKGEIGKLITTRIALAVVSIVCISPLAVSNISNSLVMLASVAMFAFYYFLVHTQFWTLGAKNKISADGGRMVLNPLSGLYMGLLASIPSFILNIVFISTSFYADYQGFKQVNQITAILEFLWDAPASGIMAVTESPFSYLAASILPALFAGLAYFLGTKEFKLFGSGKK